MSKTPNHGVSGGVHGWSASHRGKLAVGLAPGAELLAQVQETVACVRSAADALLGLPGAPVTAGLKPAAEGLLAAVDAVPAPAAEVSGPAEPAGDAPPADEASPAAEPGRHRRLCRAGRWRAPGKGRGRPDRASPLRKLPNRDLWSGTVVVSLVGGAG